MELFTTKTPSSHKLIKGLFFIFLTAFLAGLTLFFTMKINLTANAPAGEIVSEEVAIQYLAPFECEVEKVLVKEGDFVNAGDTLLILSNEKMQSDLLKNQNSLDAAHRNIEIYEKQIENFEKTMTEQKKELGIIKKEHRNKKKGKKYEVRKIKEQLEVLENKKTISKNRIQQDYQLLKKGAISKKQYDRRYKTYLDEVDKLNQLKNDLRVQSASDDNLGTRYAEKLNKYNQNTLQLESDFLTQQKTLEQEKDKKEQLESKIETIQNQLGKLVIIAEKEGYVVNLFNQEKDLNIVGKKTSLLYLSPNAGQNFYAKLLVNEDEVKDIHPGQTVHIKIKAYNHYQYGILKGKVKHVDRQIIDKKKNPTQKENFYAIVDIPAEETQKMDLKNGYKVDGEIVLNEVRLYQFVFSSMFRSN